MWVLVLLSISLIFSAAVLAIAIMIERQEKKASERTIRLRKFADDLEAYSSHSYRLSLKGDEFLVDAKNVSEAWGKARRIVGENWQSVRMLNK